MQTKLNPLTAQLMPAPGPQQGLAISPERMAQTLKSLVETHPLDLTEVFPLPLGKTLMHRVAEREAQSSLTKAATQKIPQAINFLPTKAK